MKNAAVHRSYFIILGYFCSDSNIDKFMLVSRVLVTKYCFKKILLWGHVQNYFFFIFHNFDILT